MGRRSTIAIISLAVVVAGSALCKENSLPDISTTEIYQIDYRGPETHNSLTPPESSWSDPNSKPSKKDKNRKPVHG